MLRDERSETRALTIYAAMRSWHNTDYIATLQPALFCYGSGCLCTLFMRKTIYATTDEQCWFDTTCSETHFKAYTHLKGQFTQKMIQPRADFFSSVKQHWTLFVWKKKLKYENSYSFGTIWVNDELYLPVTLANIERQKQYIPCPYNQLYRTTQKNPDCSLVCKRASPLE